MLYGSGADAKAALVAKHVKGGVEPKADSSLAEGEVRLVLGKDFVGIVDDAGKTVVSSPKSSVSTTTTADPTMITDRDRPHPGRATARRHLRLTGRPRSATADLARRRAAHP